MQGEKFPVSIHLGGTLAANQQGIIAFPFAVTFIGAQIVASNAASSTLTLGTVAAPTAHMAAKAVGQSGVPVKLTNASLDGVALPTDWIAGVSKLHIAKDTPIQWVLDFDGAAGTAGQNVDLLFFFCEG